MTRREYLRHLVLSIGTRLAMIALRLLRNILLARLLGPADRGVFALFAALPELIASITSGGLNTAVGCDAARQRPMALLLTQVLVYGCLLAGLVTLAGVLLLDRFGGDLDLTRSLGSLLWLLLLAVPLMVLKTGLLTLHNADARVDAFNVLRLLESFLPLVLFLGLWLIWRDAPLMAAVGSWLLGTALVVVIGLCWLGRYHRLGLSWVRGEQRQLLRLSAQSHPGVLAQQVMMRSDYLFIGVLLDPVALGLYAMASAAAELLLIVPEAVTTPLMKRLLQQGEAIRELTPLALRLTTTVMLAGCVGFALTGEWLIVVLFGIDYAPAYPALLALLPGLVGLCFASILRLDLLGKERAGALSLTMTAGAVANLILNAALIPALGIVGAALASSLSYLLVGMIMLTLYCRLSGVAWYRTLILLPADCAYLLGMVWPGRQHG